MCGKRRLYVGLMVAALAGAGLLRSQVLITSGTLTTTDQADSTHEGFTFRNTTVALAGFVAGGKEYEVVGMADAVMVRRNATSVLRSHMWYATEGLNGPRIADYQASFDDSLLSNNFARGVQNLFGNGTGTGSYGNVERVDFVYFGGTVADAGLAIPVFDYGAPTSHESHRIALITSVDEFGNPTGYSDLAGTAAGWGQTNLYTHDQFAIQRYNSDATTSNYQIFTGSNQGAGGVAYTLADFGVEAGTTIYGYSLFGYDVLPTDNLLDWTTFPTNTNDGEAQSGGFDFAAVNGILFSAVPEPSTYGLVAFAALAAGPLMRRRRRATVQAAS